MFAGTVKVNVRDVPVPDTVAGAVNVPPLPASETVKAGAATPFGKPAASNETCVLGEAVEGFRFESVNVRAMTVNASTRVIVEIPATCTVRGPRVASGEMVNVATKFCP